MNRFTAIACALALGLTAAPAVMAQSSGGPGGQCQNGRGNQGVQCPPPGQAQNRPGTQDHQPGRGNPPGQQQGHQQPGRGNPQQGHDNRQGQWQGRAPQIGDRARGGQPFQQAQNSRLPRPPHGQEYRVYRDHVVRVDRDTLKVVAVVGLLSALMR